MTIFNKVIVLVISAAAVLTSCNRQIVAQKDAKSYYYDCPMHNDYIRFKPGNCEICGMTLVKWEAGKMQNKNQNKVQNSNNSHSDHSGSGSFGSSGRHQH